MSNFRVDDDGVRDRVRSYLASSKQAEEPALGTLLDDPMLLVHWYDAVLPELEANFQQFFDATPTLRGDERAGFDRVIAKWNQLGIRVALGRVRVPTARLYFVEASVTGAPLAEALYKMLLSLVRGSQLRWGWIGKGLMYHQIGWSKVVTGLETEVAAAEDYFTTAMIEDMLSDLQASDGVSPFVNANESMPYRVAPAYTMLSFLYRRPSSLLDKIFRYVSNVFEQRDNPVQHLLFYNAELILLQLQSEPTGTVR